MEFLIIAVVLIAGAYFGWQYYQAKKAVIDPYVSKLTSEAKEAAKKVDVEKVLDVNKDGKVDMADATIIANTAKQAADTVKKTVKKTAAKKAPAKKKPTMKIVK